MLSIISAKNRTFAHIQPITFPFLIPSSACFLYSVPLLPAHVRRDCLSGKRASNRNAFQNARTYQSEGHTSLCQNHIQKSHRGHEGIKEQAEGLEVGIRSDEIWRHLMISGDNRLRRFAAAWECGYLCFKPKRTFYGNNHHQIRHGSASFLRWNEKGIGPHRPFANGQPALIGRGKLSDRYGTSRKTQAKQAYAAGLQKQRHIALLPNRRKILYRESDIVQLPEKNRKEAFWHPVLFMGKRVHFKMYILMHPHVVIICTQDVLQLILTLYSLVVILRLDTASKSVSVK